MSKITRLKLAPLSSLSLLALLLPATAIQANEDTSAMSMPDSDDTSHRLVITGSPMRQSIDGVNEALDEYDDQALIDAGALLSRYPGISGIRSGGHAVDPVLRGQSQTRINLLQQGAFLHGAGPNRMDSPGSYIEPFGWDEVQIIKGVETFTLGAGGPAGSIVFKRFRPQPSDNLVSGKAMVSFSSDFNKLAFDLASVGESGYLRAISQRFDQDNYEDGDGQQTRTAFTTVSHTLVGGWTPSDSQELRVTLMANRGSDALFAGTMMDGPVIDMDSAQLMFIDGDESSDNYAEYQLYYNKAHHVMDNFSLRTQTAPMKMLTDSNAKTSGAKWTKRWQLEQWIWQTTLDWQKVERQANRYMNMMAMPESAPTMLQSTIWPDNTFDNKGAAIEAEYRFAAEGDRVGRSKFGLRFDQNQADADDPANTMLYGQYYGAVELTQSESLWSAFGRYYFGEKKAFYWLGASSTYRSPDATERYIGAKNMNPMMRWVGNPNLAAERHQQVEFGSKWQYQISDQDGSLELTAYVDQVNDFILRDRARGQAGILLSDMATIYRNTDVKLTGAEASLIQDLAAGWRLDLNLAWVKGEQSDSGQPLYQIPPLEGLLQLSWQGDSWSYWLSHRFAASQSRVDDNMMTASGLDVGESAGWGVLDFKVRYALNIDWQLSFGINNLTDKTYAYHVSRANLDPFNPEPVRVNEPGRQLWVSLLAQF